MSRTMETLKKHRERLFKKIIPRKTDVFIDDGKYKGREGIVIDKKSVIETGNGYFTVLVVLSDNKKAVEVGGDNIEIIGYCDYQKTERDYRYK